MKKKNYKKIEQFQEYLKVLPWYLLILSIIVSCFCFLPALSKPLLGPHSFRQTQNAISSFYSVKQNAPIWQNIMPVCGPPWNLPTEFPLYQYLAGKIHQFSAIPLDMSGRILSLFFLFASLVVVFALLRQIDFSFPQASLALAVVVSSPLYLFWGPSYLMETTALFFALTYMLYSIKFIDKYLISETKNVFFENRLEVISFILALLSGSLCALQKGTTWVSCAGVLVLLVVWKWRKNLSSHLLKLSIAIVILCITPLIIAKKWISYGDSLKMKNPFARELFVVTSENHNRWNYGTMEQKLDPEIWQNILQHISDQLLVPIPGIGSFFVLAILILGSFCSTKRIPLILIFLAGFLSGPLIFTNLYFEHSYYWCANGIWLLLAVGTAIAGVWECKTKLTWSTALSLLLVVAVCCAGFQVWYQKYLPILDSIPTQKQLDESWRLPIQNIVPENRTLLIIGNGWNPNSLYYAERKGIAFPDAVIMGNHVLTPGLLRFSIPGSELEESLKNLKTDEKLGAVVFAETLIKSENQQEFADILKKFGMSLEGIRTPFGIVFPATDLIKK